MTLILESASVFAALRAQLGTWALQDHEFDPDLDEVRMSYDLAGSGRVALTLGFELSEAQMARLLQDASPAAHSADAATDGPTYSMPASGVDSER